MVKSIQIYIKERNFMERDIIIAGVHIGEHSFEPDAIITEIKERCIEIGRAHV